MKKISKIEIEKVIERIKAADTSKEEKLRLIKELNEFMKEINEIITDTLKKAQA